MRAALVACFVALFASSVTAQKPDLKRVDSLLTAGESAQAAALLKQWQQSNPGDNNVQALYLAAQLEVDADLARELYVSIALSHPISRYAPPSLLRLGQLSHTAGEWQRAIGYLDRLLADYPAAQERESAYLWLIRANMASGRSSEACRLAGVALRGEVRDPALNEQVRGEERRACGAVAAAPVTGIAAATPASTAQPTPPPAPAANASRPAASPAAGSTTPTPSPSTNASRPATSSAAGSTGPAASPAANTTRSNASFAVQTGAFREVRGANSVASGLRQAGFDARVTQVEGTSLHHVRVGFFTARADASAMMQRIRDKGFNAMIVDDVKREK